MQSAPSLFGKLGGRRGNLSVDPGNVCPPGFTRYAGRPSSAAPDLIGVCAASWTRTRGPVTTRTPLLALRKGVTRREGRASTSVSHRPHVRYVPDGGPVRGAFRPARAISRVAARRFFAPREPPQARAPDHPGSGPPPARARGRLHPARARAPAGCASPSERT